MLPIATRTRSGLLSPNQLRKISTAYEALDVTGHVDVSATIDLDLGNIQGAPFIGNHTRASIGGYRLNNKGLLVPTVVNEPYINFASDGTPLGIVLNNSYTNLLLYSEEFDNGYYTLTGTSTISANATVAPDGNTTADKVLEGAVTTSKGWRRSFTLAVSTTYTFSVFAKAAERSEIQLVLVDSVFSFSAFFNLQTGTVMSTAGDLVGSTQIVSVGNGWYRCSITATTSPSSAAGGYVDIRLSSGGSASYLGNGTSGLYTWGGNLTATSFPVPYLQTTSATVGRNADDFNITGTDFADAFNASEGSIYVEGDFPVATGTIIQLDDGTNNNRHLLYKVGVDLSWTTVSSTSVVADRRAFDVPIGQSYKTAFSYMSNLFIAAFNGSSPADDTSGVLPTGINRLLFGRTGYHVKRVVYWPKAFSKIQLQRMTV